MRFSKDTTGPANQAFERKQQVYAGTLGPNAPAKLDPRAFMKNWTAKLYGDQPDAKRLYDSSFFSADNANAFKDKVANMTDSATFDSPDDNALADKFLADYRNSSVLEEKEKVYKESLAPLINEQPSQGVGLGTSAHIMKFAGTNSTSVS